MRWMGWVDGVDRSWLMRMGLFVGINEFLDVCTDELIDFINNLVVYRSIL